MTLPLAMLCAACMIAAPPAHEPGRDSITTASDGAFQVRSAQAQTPDLLKLDDDLAAQKIAQLNPQLRATALATALARAWKRGFIEEGIEETKNTLVACQRETSLLMIMPFMRSEGQQAHCYRF
jgi:hypothetical protein